MDTTSIPQSHNKTTKEPSSLLSQMTLHFEYNKTINEERSTLAPRQTTGKK